MVTPMARNQRCRPTGGTFRNINNCDGDDRHSPMTLVSFASYRNRRYNANCQQRKEKHYDENLDTGVKIPRSL
jgi:hypothetical protein